MSSLRPGRTKSPPIYNIAMYVIVFVVVFLVSDVSCSRQKQLIDTRNNDPSSQLSVMPFEQITYSVANVSNNYKSSTKFHHRGMGHLYFITHQFINFVFKGQIYPEGTFIDSCYLLFSCYLLVRRCSLCLQYFND